MTTPTPPQPPGAPQPGVRVGGGGGLADRAGFIILGNTVQSLAQMAVVMVLARVFERADYGSYRQAWLVYWMLSPVLLMGIPSSVLYFLPRLEGEERRRFVLRTLGLLVVMGAGLCGVIAAAAGRIAGWMHNPALGPLLRVFSLYAVFGLPAAALPYLLIGEGRHRAAAAVNGGFALMLAAGVVSAAAVTRDVGWALRATVGVGLLQMGIAAAIVLRSCATRPRLDWAGLKAQLAWSLPVGFSGVIAVLARRVGHTVVAVTTRFTRADYAVYDVGAFEVPFVGAFTFAITQTLLPVFSGMHHRDQIDSLIRLWHESIRKVALLLFPVFVVLMLCADQIVVILFSERFAASAPIFRVYLLLLPLRTTTYSSVLQSAGDTKALAVGTTGALLTVAALGVTLAHTVGLIGPAVALVAANYGVTVYWLLRMRRTLGIGFAETFPWRKVGPIFGLALAPGALLLPVPGLGLGPWPTVGIIVPVYAALYLVAVLKTGLLTGRDRALAARWLTLSALRGPRAEGREVVEDAAAGQGTRPAREPE